jgi:hypothetical protein
MGYLGNQPAESYASFEKQVFTIVNSQTAYTLSHSVVNENDIRLVVNSVVQEPGSGKAYTASGTTLTLSAALVNGTDTMYCVFLGRALQTVNAPNASVGSAQVADSLISGKTALGATPADTDELLISDAGTLKRVDYSYLKAANTPNFLVTRSGNQSISLNTDTKVQWDSETFDTDNAFDSSTNYRFTPQVAGKYYLFSNIYLANGSNANNTTYTPKIFKNGSKVIESHIDHRTAGIGYQQSVPVAGFVEANGSSDYFEIFANGNWTGGSINVTAQSFFGGYKIIE